MGTLQDELEAQLQKLPRIFCEKIVSEKLAALGVNDPQLTRSVVEHVIDDADLIVEEGSPVAQLAFDDTDTKRIEEMLDSFLNEGRLIDDLSKISADIYLGGLRANWKERDKDNAEEFSSFRARLEKRWGEPLASLRLMLQLSRDLGDEFYQAHLASKLKRNRAKNEVLVRLHNRACQTSAEIIVLLESGFPEGAYARWRTLLELKTSAVLVNEGGDVLAERFLAYEAVERKRTMDEHDRCATLNGEPRTPYLMARETNKAFASVKARYGEEMKEPYGWIAGQLGLPLRPKFSQMQEMAGGTPFRLHYKLASFGVHVTPQASVTYSFLDNEIRTAGATNAGLETPGANTAHSLTRITSLLFSDPWDLDKIALGRALLLLRDETSIGFHQTAKRLERDELKAQRAIERHFTLYQGRTRPFKRRMRTARG